MKKFIKVNNVINSLLYGYNLYNITGNMANTLSNETAIVVEHIFSENSYYAIPILTPYDFFTNKSFRNKWKTLIEYPCRDGFILPVDIAYVNSNIPQCFLIYEFFQNSRYTGLSELAKNDEYLGMENDYIRKIVLNILNAFISIENSNYLYFGLDDDDIFISEESSDVLLPIRTEFSVGRNSVINHLQEDYYSEVLDPYSNMNKSIYDNKVYYSYDKFSEKYSLISIIFRLMIGLYPYEGPYMSEYEYRHNSKDNIDWIDKYIQNPVFIFDESNKTNSIEIYNKNIKHRERWKLLNEKLKEMFTSSLVYSNVLRSNRVVFYSYKDWYQELSNFFNSTF